MRTYHFLTYLRVAIFGLAILFTTSLATAQEVFTDCDAWADSVCGEIVDNDFQSLLDFNGEVVAGDDTFTAGDVVQTLSWGELTFSTDVFTGLTIIRINGVNLVPFEVGSPLLFTPNSDQLPFEGVCFEYFANADITFRAFDGDTVVETVTFPATSPDADGGLIDGEPGIVGWQNTDGLNITSFEFELAEGGTLGAIGAGEFSFGEICPPEVPEVPTCFDQLGQVKANTEALLPELTGSDLYFAECALDCICWMQSDTFWEQPSGNRLTRYGGTMFVGAAYTIWYLECVEDSRSDVIIDELIGVLECIVDNEILYAIENGGNQCYIDRAEDFADLAEIIDDDFENEVVATLAYRLAWLNAFYATE